MTKYRKKSWQLNRKNNQEKKSWQKKEKIKEEDCITLGGFIYGCKQLLKEAMLNWDLMGGQERVRSMG